MYRNIYIYIIIIIYSYSVLAISHVVLLPVVIKKTLLGVG